MGGKNSTWLTPIPKQSLSKMVVEKIKEALINGDIKPGDFLPSETELAVWYFLSKQRINVRAL